MRSTLDAMDATRLRQMLLYVVAAVFFLEAVMALVDPAAAAVRVGYGALGVDGLSEYRAVYLGMFSALGVVALVAARRVHEPLLGDVVAAAIVAEAAARLVGVVLDGVPGPVHLVNLAMESAPLAVLVIRPRTPPGVANGRAR